MKLAFHYRDSLNQPLCKNCAKDHILRLYPQVEVEESDISKGYDPLECSGCFNIILTVEEHAARILNAS